MSNSPASEGLTRASFWGLPSWYLKSYRMFVMVVLGLIILGGSVRVFNAGLACPDWPLCFGDVIPDFHPQVYFEFIHRALAGLVSIALVVLHFILLFNHNVPAKLKWLAMFALLVLTFQILFGALTVVYQLKAGVVATHLGLGTGLFALAVWIYQSLAFRPDEANPQSGVVVGQTTLMLIVAYSQILLGGLVASNYAANVCPGEFPTCYGQFFPTFSGQIGLHIIHRTWAYVVLLLAVMTFIIIRRSGTDIPLRKLAMTFIIVVGFQVVLGISNVLFYTPPILAILHLAFGVKILWLCVRMIHRARGVAV